MKPKKILLLAVLSGIITTALFYLFLNKQTAATSASEPVIEMKQVVAAEVDIPKDQQILKENLVVKEIPSDQVHPEMIQDMNTALNQYTTADIKQGEILMNHRIQEKEEEKEVVSRKINEGYRAVSAEVTYVTGVSNLIQPEDYVDVVLTSGEKIESEIILEKVRVLAVGERMTEKKDPAAEPVLYHAVTLELNQEDTVKLVEASAKGVLQLALYSKSDLEEEAESDSNKKTGTDKAAKGTEIITIPAKSIIRQAPSLLANPIEVVKEDTTLLLLNNQETDKDGRIWLQVEMDNKEKGWISSRIIKNEQE
ncbi:Flp pilus assembly protein CpaB [Oceanobacillus piezotolerans]|uniref:Flp pilus assembly protein CpaB n=1 Tax=Oceanobacillus piezotolerans TaxID=2448030 RepID=A0A498D9E2_9BACI|nr:Flp pilus assembly protein CpaB [Oceanobacillus piezotolerans]RLL47033.1 Flp pilus assembly protein CpaB [Oceanobacillus piezotolerans]